MESWKIHGSSRGRWFFLFGNPTGPTPNHMPRGPKHLPPFVSNRKQWNGIRTIRSSPPSPQPPTPLNISPHPQPACIHLPSHVSSPYCFIYSNSLPWLISEFSSFSIFPAPVNGGCWFRSWCGRWVFVAFRHGRLEPFVPLFSASKASDPCQACG